MNLSGVWDWTFFWNTFGFLLKTVSNYVIIIVAIIAVGMLLQVVISAVRNGRST